VSAPIAPPAPAPVRNPAWWQGRLALLAAVIAGVLLTLAPRADESSAGAAFFRVGVFAKRAGVVRPVPEDGRIEPGSELLFATWAAEARHVAVILADAAGRTVVAFPPEGRAPALHGAGRGVPLVGPQVTAAIPGPLAIHAYFCDEPLDLASIRTQLEAGGSPEPAGCTVDQTAIAVAGP
jgi:hypothetical protein